MVRMAGPPAIEAPRWIAPGIAFVRFNLFPGDSAIVEAARSFMADHADAKTIIFDIRTHRGGGLDEMNAIFPYLFAQPATLVTMDTRASVDSAGGNPIGEGPAMRRVPAGDDVVRREHFVTPHPTEKRLFDSKVYVLTSAFTGSAAEHFALALKRTHRATLIGETTGGAGNYGGLRPLGDRFSVFVPVGRTFDADTGKGWEGTGVDPDVAVPADRALVEALTRSGIARAEAERLSAEVAPEGPMTRIVPRRP
jgi:C-terminal processing protease CtpA/Prc